MKQVKFFILKLKTVTQLNTFNLHPPKTYRKTHRKRFDSMPPTFRYKQHFTCNIIYAMNIN